MFRKCGLLLLSCVFLFSSCAYQSSIPNTISVEELREEAEEYRAEMTEKEEKRILSGDTVFYWSPSGSVYHLDPDCQYLAKAKSVESGTLTRAKEYGIEKACSRCCRGYTLPETDVTEPTEEPTEEQTEVYWVSGGSVWHSDSNCRFIRQSDSVLHGTVQEANEAGKSKGCSSCAK